MAGVKSGHQGFATCGCERGRLEWVVRWKGRAGGIEAREGGTFVVFCVEMGVHNGFCFVVEV